MSKSIKLKNNNYWNSNSIVHNKKKLADILDGVVFYKDRADLNANNNTTNGLFVVPQSSNATNYPISGGNGILIVFRTGDGIKYQIFSLYDGSTWVRVCWYTYWYSWKKITS